MMFAPTTAVTPWQLRAAAAIKRRQREATGATVQEELHRPSLSEFIREAWHVLEPATRYVHGWHIDAIGDHLEAISRGELRRLIINVPPGLMKSLTVSVMWPVWDWIENPWRRYLTASYSQSLSTRDALRSRRLIQSNWYKGNWGRVFKLAGDQNQKMRYENDKMGFRIATSVGGTVTGERGHIRVLDDPHKAGSVHSPSILMSDLDWLKTTWSTRDNDPKLSAEVVVMQRLHERDASGYYLEEVGGYEHLMFPMRFEPGRRCHTVLGFSDPRQEEGELLAPDRFDEESVGGLEKRLGPYDTAGQLQQRPSPAEGGIFKQSWWRFWTPVGVTLPPVHLQSKEGEIIECVQAPLPDMDNMELVIQSWDMTFKDTAAADKVSGQVWGKLAANRYLLDRMNGRMDMPATMQAVEKMTIFWPTARLKLVEDKANGPAVVQMLRNKISGMVEVTPEGGKVSRAQAMIPAVWAGNVWLPHPHVAPWVHDLIAEFTMFPNGAHDDDVDSATQANIYFNSLDEKRGDKPAVGAAHVTMVADVFG